EVPEELAAVGARMLAKDRARRFQTPAEVALALGPWTAEPVGPPPEEEMPRHCPAVRHALGVESVPARRGLGERATGGESMGATKGRVRGSRGAGPWFFVAASFQLARHQLGRRKRSLAPEPPEVSDPKAAQPHQAQDDPGGSGDADGRGACRF